MWVKRLYLTFVILLLFGCAVQRTVIQAPDLEKIPSPESPVCREPLTEEDLFQKLVQRCRVQAVTYEKEEELRKSLFCWKVVGSFLPMDKEASEGVKRVEAQVRTEAEKHFLKGLEYFHKESTQAARKEFLIALTYDPDHMKALDYLKHKLNDSDVIIYETIAGDTLKAVSQAIYKDSGKDFLIAYFNDLDIRNPLKSGMILELPVIPPAWTSKTAHSEERTPKPNPLPKPGRVEVLSQEQAEAHYGKGISHFLAENLDKAIQEWEETLRLNPDHPNAKRDLQKARRMLENLKELK